ncbi:MAG TPA: M23 family metallopeptidase [Puia sp.]|jgi:murein DD-endopeptidase MepM/ murein hydrolase activator NlpD|nr:M23 family metallopeptidase [Puia sp.]
MRYLITAVVSLCWLSVWAQSASSLFDATDYPQHYFRDPLGIPMSLAANFGELRPNHYHMGLDIRTQHRENLPVYAAADGYIARVQIEPFGFGQAIYIRHPGGYTTVYGHLNRFFPALAVYVEQQQYRQQSWQVDLTIPPALFPVRQGQQVAWSGSTGGSEGPHLHFEIRLTREDVNLNPLLFGLPVEDRVAPKISKLAWYDGNQGIYDQSAHILPVRKGAAAWTIMPAVLTVPTNRICFGISAFDAQSGSTNPNGIYQSVLYEDERPIIGFEMNNISYDNTRNINAHIDYKTRIMGGPFLQQLFFLPGYPFPSIYRVPGTPSGKDPAEATARSAAIGTSPGLLDLSDGHLHAIRIEVRDTRGNSSELTFNVQYQAVSAQDATASAQLPMNPNLAGAESEPADSILQDIGVKKFYPGMIDGIELKYGAFYLAEGSLYDSAHLLISDIGYAGGGYSLPSGISDVFQIGEPWIPLRDPVLVRIQPTRALDADSLPGKSWVSLTELTDKIVMVCSNGKQKDVRRPEWQNGWASARFREFGSFQLVYDTVPPVILPIGPLEAADLSHATRIAFSVKDDLGTLSRFRAELDGRWLCFTNDKGLSYIYKFDEHCPPGPHTLKVTVEDVAGNRSEKEYHFNR